MARTILLVVVFSLAAIGFFPGEHPRAQTERTMSAPETARSDQIRHLRSLPDDVRARTRKQLAIDIRRLPVTLNKLHLANSLAHLSTEGDFGHDTLQEVTATLADALREQPLPMEGNQPNSAYVELATLVRYEQMQASLNNPQFAAAIAKLEAHDKQREGADCTLDDVERKTWTLQALRGKIVMVN